MNQAQHLFKQTQQACQMMGFHLSDLSNVFDLDNDAIDPNSQQGELARTLIHICQLLQALMGYAAMKSFMFCENKNTKGMPIEQIKMPGGIEAIHAYLDAIP